MDIICTGCGKAWELDLVLYEEPEGFDRDGCDLWSCPCCKAREQACGSHSEHERLQSIRVLAELYGEHVDRFAAALEDFDLL